MTRWAARDQARKVYASPARIVTIDEAGPSVDVDGDVDLTLERPRTRSDCDRVPRPCPFVGCIHNNFLDVQQDGRSLRLNFAEPSDMSSSSSCALDVAELAGRSVDEVARALNISHTRVVQLEARALAKIEGPARRLFQVIEEDARRARRRLPIAR